MKYLRYFCKKICGKDLSKSPNLVTLFDANTQDVVVDDDGGVSDEEQTRLFVRSFEHVLRSRETDEMS